MCSFQVVFCVVFVTSGLTGANRFLVRCLRLLQQLLMRQLIRQQVSKEAQQIQLELGDFSAGIYYVTVFSKDNQWQYEVVVK